MKRLFLLDENILIQAVEEVDEHGNRDSTRAMLVRLIIQNCHRIAMHGSIWQRFMRHLGARDKTRHFAHQTVSSLVLFLWNSEKFVQQLDPLPDVPPDVIFPRKDEHILRCALAAKALVVTTDGGIRAAIEASPALGLTVLSPSEALELAASV